jgi:predicted ATPase/DNA-binding SARP family transcriptional activator
MPSTLHIRLLGDFHLVYGETVVTRLNADRLQSLLAYLLLHRRAPQPRQQLAFLIWPDSTEAQARGNLRNLLHQLRRALPDADEFIEIESLTLQWRPGAPFVLDVADFQAALAEAKRAEQAGEQATARQALERAVTLYQGDLMPGCYDDWIIPIREELRQSLQAALERLLHLLEAMQEYREAIRYAQRLVQFDPLYEAGYVQWMRLHALGGDRAAVRRVYDSCVNVLKRELGVGPSQTTREAFERLLRLEPLPAATVEPQAVPAPARQAPAPATQARPLPPQPTPFLGREEELEEIAVLLADSACRLLSVVGPGGMGKTRLALRVAERHAEEGGEAAFVPLAPVGSAELLVPAVADALGLAFYGGTDPRTQLFNFLRERRTLLVLDNFEHLLEGAELLSEMLRHAPGVKLLVTSRVRLNLHEEWVFSIEGLPVPAQGEGMKESSATALFVQSARRVTSGFTVGADERVAVARICRMVEGMPLGIELAAAWARMLSPQEIAQEIERSLDFLVNSQRNAPERHRSLRALFDHSWKLLSPPEQQALRRLSVFRGGFRRDAAEQVAGATLPVLSALVDQSLLRRAEGGRYDLHELLRQFAASKLQEEAEEERAARDLHSSYYLGLLHTRLKALEGVGQQAALVELGAEVDNLRAAWQWATEQGNFEAMRKAARSISRLFQMRGWLYEAAILFRRAVEVLENSEQAAGEHRAALGQMLVNQGYCYTILQDPEKVGRGLLNRAITLLRGSEEQTSLGEALSYASILAFKAGDFAEARPLAEEAIALSRQHGDAWILALTLNALGLVDQRVGRYEEARAHYAEAIAICRATGNLQGAALALNFDSDTAHALGKYAEARQALLESLEICRTLNDRWLTATALCQLGLVTHALGESAEAVSLFRESLSLFREVEDRWYVARTMNDLADVLCALERHGAAREVYREAFTTAVAEQARSVAMEALMGLTTLTARDEGGPDEYLLSLLLYIQAHPASSEQTRNQAEQLWEKLQPRFSPQQIAAAQERAVTLTLEALAGEILQTAHVIGY